MSEPTDQDERRYNPGGEWGCVPVLLVALVVALCAWLVIA